MNASAIAGWLQYDTSRVRDVEDAYSTFVRTARMGIVLPCALVISIGAAALLPHAWTRQGVYTVGFTTYYLLLLMPLIWVSKPVLGTMWRGAVDWPKACLWGLPIGVVAGVAAELLNMIPIVHQMPLPLKAANTLLLDVLWALVVTVAGAAWMQTRFGSSTIEGLSDRRPYLMGSVTLAPLAMIFLSLAAYGTLPILIAAFYQRATGRSLAAVLAVAFVSLATLNLLWLLPGVPR